MATTRLTGSVAQSVEQRTFNPLVASSSLARPTIDGLLAPRLRAENHVIAMVFRLETTKNPEYRLACIE